MSLHKSNTAWMSWWAPPSYLHHCNCDWLNHTRWFNGSCRRIPCGMVAAIHTWFHSNPALPRSMGFESILFHFWTQYRCQYAMKTVWWSQIHWHISPFTSGILLSWKTKNLFVFFCINVWTLVTFTFTPHKLFKLTNQRHLCWVCANILRIFFFFLSLLNFSHSKKISSYGHLFRLRIASYSG